MTTRPVCTHVSAACAGAFVLAFVATPAIAQSDPIGRGLAAAATTAARTAASASAAADVAQGQAAPADPQAPAPAAENPTLKFFAGTEISGFVDTYYSYNFNKPSVGTPFGTSGVTVFNQLHNFDVAHNSFSLSLAEVALEKKPTAESRGGFRVDLDYGSAAAMVAGFEPGGTTLYQNIQQAYVSYLAPTGSGLQFDFGKFVTPAGFEVIEAKDNWNYSRGLLFALAIPYYHMGMRAAYSLNDKVSVTGFLFNGWNNVVDNNTGKSVGLSVTGKPNGNLTMIENYIGGPETTGTNTPWRHLSDTVLTYTVSKATSVAFNYDWAKDGDVQWQGFAAYLKYQANDWFALTPRYEYFKDRDGFATGTRQNVQDFTLTTEFKHKDGVIMRIEYRGDFSNTPYFLKETSDLTKNQQALTIAWIFAFSSKTP